jgi:trimethylamine--corrinoid protein Co-methyltransferase
MRRRSDLGWESVRILPHLVEERVTVPKSVHLHRKSRRKLNSETSTWPRPDAAYIYDSPPPPASTAPTQHVSGRRPAQPGPEFETRLVGQRRKAVMADVVSAARLADGLPNLDFLMSQFMPSDVPLEKYERVQMATMLQESTKPIVFVGLERLSTVYAIEMAAAVAGGVEELARYPFVVNYVNFTSPFNHNEESVERLLYAAERNLPSIYTPGRARGSEVPITEAGAVALVNAGQLAGLTLSQLKREGSPFIWASPSGGGLDMRTMVSVYAAPDSGPASWDLAHHYELPIFGFAGVSDAKAFDAQAAAEATLTLFENALFGANLVHDIGLLDCAMTGSLEMAVSATR